MAFPVLAVGIHRAAFQVVVAFLAWACPVVAVDSLAVAYQVAVAFLVVAFPVAVVLLEEVWVFPDPLPVAEVELVLHPGLELVVVAELVLRLGLLLSGCFVGYFVDP